MILEKILQLCIITFFYASVIGAAAVTSRKPSRRPSRKPSKRTTRKPVPRKPTSKPSRRKTKKSTKKPTRKPSVRKTRKPSRRPSSGKTWKPSTKPTSNPTSFNSIWGPNITQFISWRGWVEFGQTHVINAIGEWRYAPKVIAEREAELLFTPSLTAQPTPAPTLAPTAPVRFQWGIEQLNNDSLTVTPLNATSWPAGYPNDAKILLVDSTEYYIPNTIPNVDADFDLLSNYTIQGVYVQTWFDTVLRSIHVGLRATANDDWAWFVMNFDNNYNAELVTTIPKLSSRFVKFRIMGGYSSFGSEWGLRRIKIGGVAHTTSTPASSTSISRRHLSSSSPYFPALTSNVKLLAKAADGTVLGTMILRSPDKIRPILEQSLLTNTLPPYSSSAWSCSLPWNWIRENTELLIGTVDPNDSTKLFLYRLVLKGLVQFSEHTLTRTKVLIFGNSTDVRNFNTNTIAAYDLATGMFNAMPISSLTWIDSADWHLPYIVTPTLAGPRLVRNERERRSAFSAAGQDPGTEPGWEILKDQLTLRHNLAHTGCGLTITQEGGDNSPYSSGTSIFMGWALTEKVNGKWYFDPLSDWTDWSGAGYTGWTIIPPGDECGNALIHEVGHSQTMDHFTSGTAAQWGIADQYPNDGVNEPWSPWGWHATSRRFRAWYRDNQRVEGKYDPMNGGEDANEESCFPQYTAYGAQKSQNWGSRSPILLSSSVSGVSDGDGAYHFDAFTGRYKKIVNEEIKDKVSPSAMPPVQVGVPTYTFIGTLGADPTVCQTYPPIAASSGNTFVFPNPFNASLGSYFNNAKFMFEIAYNDSTIDRGLIAVADLNGSKSLAYYSFTVAMHRKPMSVKLYKYARAYPNINASTGKTLLHQRLVVPVSDFPSTTRVGRGWLGHSSDAVIKGLCFSAADCASNPIKFMWRSTDGHKYTLSTNYTSVRSVGNATIFTLKARRLQNDLVYDVNVSASRFLQEGGPIFPLLSVPVSNLSIPSDASHGILFTAPYYLNANLPAGTYSSVSNNITIQGFRSTTPSSSWKLRLTVSFNLRSPTDNIDISAGKTFTSKAINATIPSDSSVYFVATDPAIGPTKGFWWGDWDGYTTLSVPLFSSCLGGYLNGTSVRALIRVQQLSCNERWEMNAGRGADGCAHALELTLDSVRVNPWRLTTAVGCLLSSHPRSPVVIEARRWHTPLSAMLIYSFVFNITLKIT